MSFTAIIIVTLALGAILGGIFLLKKSATKFQLTDEQLKKVNQRNQQQNIKDKE
jgi:hypothetical protein